MRICCFGSKLVCGIQSQRLEAGRSPKPPRWHTLLKGRGQGVREGRPKLSPCSSVMTEPQVMSTVTSQTVQTFAPQNRDPEPRSHPTQLGNEAVVALRKTCLCWDEGSTGFGSESDKVTLLLAHACAASQKQRGEAGTRSGIPCKMLSSTQAQLEQPACCRVRGSFFVSEKSAGQVESRVDDD